MSWQIIQTLSQAHVLSFYGARIRVPKDLALTEVGLIRHVTRDGRMIAKDCVLNDRLATLDRLKERQQMRLVVIPVVTRIDCLRRQRFVSDGRIVLGMPFANIFVPAFFQGSSCRNSWARYPYQIAMNNESRIQWHR